MTAPIEVEILAASNSTDRGLRALVDLAAAADPDTVNTRRPLSRNDVNATSVIPCRNRPGDSVEVLSKLPVPLDEDLGERLALIQYVQSLVDDSAKLAMQTPPHLWIRGSSCL